MDNDKLVILRVTADDNHRARLSTSTPVNAGNRVLSPVNRNVIDALRHRLISAARFQFSTRHHVLAKRRRQSEALVFKLREIINALTCFDFTKIKPGHHEVIDPIPFSPIGVRTTGYPFARSYVKHRRAGWTNNG